MKKVLLALLVVALGVACTKEEEKKTSETNPLGYIITHFSEDYGQVSRASESPSTIEGYFLKEERCLELTFYGDYSTAVVTVSSENIGKKEEHILNNQKHVSLPVSEYSGNLDITVVIDDNYTFTASISI